MTAQLNLKDIERRAFRSTYQDGLWDMYLGLVVMSMSVFMYYPETGYSPTNIVFAILMISTSLLFLPPLWIRSHYYFGSLY